MTSTNINIKDQLVVVPDNHPVVKSAKRQIRQSLNSLRNLSLTAYLHFVSMEKIFTASIPTGATDGRVLLLNPWFVNNLTPSQLLFLEMHEVDHRVRKHHLRIEDRDPVRWNGATDYQINDSLLHYFRNKLAGIHGILTTNYQHYRLFSAEEIYRRSKNPKTDKDREMKREIEHMKDQRDEARKLAEQGEWAEGKFVYGPTTPFASFGTGDVLKFDGDLSDRIAEAAAIDDIRKQVAAHANGAGSHFSDPLHEAVTEAQGSQIDYSEEMENLIAKRQVVDFDINTPRTPFWLEGMYIPGFKMERGAGHVAIVVDVSGSIDVPAFNLFAADYLRLQEQVLPESTHVIYVSNRVHAVDHYGQGEQAVLQRKGNGGTKLDAAMLNIRDLCDGRMPDCIVVFTDLDLMPGDLSMDPGVPVLFVCTTDNTTEKYGRVVHINRN